jgi:hypothetical protein
MELLHLAAAGYITYLASRHLGFKGLPSLSIVAFLSWAFLPNLVHELQAQFFDFDAPVALWQLLGLAGFAALVVGYVRFRAQRSRWLPHKSDTSIKQRLDR